MPTPSNGQLQDTDQEEDSVPTNNTASNGHPSRETSQLTGDNSTSITAESRQYGTRSRGRTNRVNYSEDNAADDIIAERLKHEYAVYYGSNTTPITRNGGNGVGDASSSSDTHNRRRTQDQPSSSNGSTPNGRRKVKNESSRDSPTPKTNTGKDGSRESSVQMEANQKKRKSTSSLSSSQLKTFMNHLRCDSRTIPDYPVNVVSNMLDLDGAKITNGVLHLADGSTFRCNDRVYLICEPPTEPYYVARIMEFCPKEGKDLSKLSSSERQNPRNYMVRVNWFYRPKDISKKSSDSRMLYATMHSDVCPLYSIRGRCYVEHREHISDIDDFRKNSDSFWFDKLYDRYIEHFYEMIPTEKIQNVPEKVKKIIMQRIKYAVVEIGKGKELCQAAESCMQCGRWCSPEDSVQCANCKNYYHMTCVNPPLLKKPSRGFAWACAACSRAEEIRLSQLHGKNLFEDQAFDNTINVPAPLSSSSSNGPARSDSVDNNKSGNGLAPRNMNDILEEAFARGEIEATEDQLRLASMWTYRYLGIHARLEDVLDRDDRIYPRAASRLGSKHQAVIPDWYGHPVEYYSVDKQDKRRRGNNSNNNNSTKDQSKEPQKDKDKPWIQPRPRGYVERGGDDTATLNWKMPEPSKMTAQEIDYFLKVELVPIANQVQMEVYSPNLIDTALEALMNNDYDKKRALSALESCTRESLKEPTFTAQEKKLFEEGVRKYGSELHPVGKVVRTQSQANIVRYYYLWKKTPSGHAIWDNFEGRNRTKKRLAKLNSRDDLVDEVADSSDDSAYDNSKALIQRRKFNCKFCHTTDSRRWYRAPGVPVALSDPISALCGRCARLWRRYAVVWEEPEEVVKKALQRGGNGWRRRVEDELIVQSIKVLTEIKKEGDNGDLKDDIRRNKRTRTSKSVISSSKEASPVVTIPDPPKATCSVCLDLDLLSNQVTCSGCGLITHGSCYGVSKSTASGSSRRKWLCDPCQNEKDPHVSFDYSCILCPITKTNSGIYGPLKPTGGNNWAHVKCAVWFPEVVFGNAKALQPVEDISNIPVSRYEEKCVICATSRNGYCVQCYICHKSFHLGCAEEAGYSFGFNLTPVKASSRRNVPIVALGDVSGSITPAVCCKDHSKSNADQLHKITEKVADSNETVLEYYCRTSKQAEMGGENATFRRAQQLAITLGGHKSVTSSKVRNFQSHVCVYCHSSGPTPFWWKTPTGVCCQLCYWEKRREKTVDLDEIPEDGPEVIIL